MSVSIRTATRSDADKLSRLWSAFMEEQAQIDDRVQPSEDALERWKNDFPAWVERDGRHIVVAVSNDEIVGFASGVRTEPAPIFAFVREAFIEEMYVVPRQRRSGIGRMLIDAIYGWAREFGAHRVRLSVAAGNRPARAFWEAVGLTELSITYCADLPEAPSVPAKNERRIGFGV